MALNPRRDRRGIDSSGRLPAQRRRVCCFEDPCGFYILVEGVVAWLFPDGATTRRAKRKIDCWMLDGIETKSWLEIRETIFNMIPRSPWRGHTTAVPTMTLNAYRLSNEPRDSRPTVLIGSASRKFARWLKETLEESGVLGSVAVHFKVKVIDLNDNVVVHKGSIEDTGVSTSSIRHRSRTPMDDPGAIV